jgi:hypothetical protein
MEHAGASRPLPFVAISLPSAARAAFAKTDIKNSSIKKPTIAGCRVVLSATWPTSNVRAEAISTRLVQSKLVFRPEVVEASPAPEHRVNIHKNARLTPIGRERSVGARAERADPGGR